MTHRMLACQVVAGAMVVALASACGGGEAASPPTATYNSASLVTSPPGLPTVPPQSSTQDRLLSARIAVDAFAAAKLPVPQQQDTTQSCLREGCEQMITTAAIGVMSFLSDDDAARYAHTRKADVFQASRVVLRYDIGGTPAADRPRYEAELTKLAACKHGPRCRT